MLGVELRSGAIDLLNQQIQDRAFRDRRPRTPQAVEHWSPTTLREMLVKIGAKVVRHGRYIMFQLAEVAIPRLLFAEILRLIDGLRPALP